MNVHLRTVVGSLAVLGALMSAATSAFGWNYTGTGQWASASYGNFTVYQDEWGSSTPMTLYANNAGNFACLVNVTGGGVKNYCHTQVNVNMPLNSGLYCTTQWNNSGGSGVYDWMYDLWTANQSDEIMVYTNYTTPTGGWGSEIASNVNIGGTQYSQVWQVNDGHNILMFFPASQSTSGTRDLYSVMNWCRNAGKLSNNTFYQASYGVEVTSSNGSEQFTCNQAGIYFN